MRAVYKVKYLFEINTMYTMPFMAPPPLGRDSEGALMEKELLLSPPAESVLFKRSVVFIEGLPEIFENFWKDLLYCGGLKIV